MTNPYKFEVLVRHFNESVNLQENKMSDGTINWNFVDADLCLRGWDVAFGRDEWDSIFCKMADDFILNDAASKLEVLKKEYLGQ